jgi:lipopolysaccharide transport system ATP-binding protein
VAVHLEPEILLVDEVLAVGDERFRQKCLLRMQEFRRRQTTMVFVSHDATAVAEVCDRVGLLEAGRLVDLGEPERVLAGYRSRAAA